MRAEVMTNTVKHAVLLNLLWLLFASPGYCTDLLQGFFVVDFLEQTKDRNGQVTQSFRFLGPELDSLQVFYQVKGDPLVYRAPWVNGRVMIIADSFSFFRLTAYGRHSSDNLLYVAQANFCLFGNASKKVERQPARLDQKLLSRIELVSPKMNYWPQTGQSFTFTIEIPPERSEIELGVVENGKFHDLVLDEQLGFNYTPHHDQALRNGGVKASRQDIILVRMSTDGDPIHLAYTLLLHRSRSGFFHNGYGVTIFLLSIGVFSLWVLGKRRWGKSPW